MLLAALAMLCAQLPPDGPRIRWATSAAIAKSYAAKLNRPILAAFFYNSFETWRVSGALLYPEVVAGAKRFTCVVVRNDKDAQALNPNLRANGPSIVFLDPSGQQIASGTGILWRSDVAELEFLAGWAIEKADMMSQPKTSLTPGQMGTLLGLHGKTAQALTVLQKANPADPWLSRGYLAVADVLRQNAKYLESLKPLQQSVQFAHKPADEWRARLRMASSLYRARMLKQAIEQARIALSIKGLSPDDRLGAQVMLGRLESTPHT